MYNEYEDEVACAHVKHEDLLKILVMKSNQVRGHTKRTRQERTINGTRTTHRPQSYNQRADPTYKHKIREEPGKQEQINS